MINKRNAKELEEIDQKLNEKDKLVLLRQRIDRGDVGEDYKKIQHKDTSEFTKSISGGSKFKKKKNNKKRRRIADDDNDDYSD